MKIKKLSFVFFGLVLALVLSSFTAFAAMPAGTVVIGDKAYSLEYANDTENQDEISSALAASDGKVYLKGFDGNWIDNVTGLPPKEINFSTVIYKRKINPSSLALFNFTPSTAVAKGQSLVNVGLVVLLSGQGTTKVTGLKISRSGLSTDSCVKGISIWDGTNRISPSTPVKDGFADISFISPVTINEGSGKNFTIKMDVNDTATPSSQIVLGLNDKNSIKATGDVGGKFPAVSNIMKVVQLEGLGGMAVTLDNLPSSVNTTTSGIALENINIKATSGNQTLNSVTLTQNGSAGDKDISDLKLYNGDKQVGFAQKVSGGKVTFTFANSEHLRVATEHESWRPDGIPSVNEITLTLKGDILSGSGKTTKFEIEDGDDIQATDNAYETTVTAPGKVISGNNLSTEIK